MIDRIDDVVFEDSNGRLEASVYYDRYGDKCLDFEKISVLEKKQKTAKKLVNRMIEFSANNEISRIHGDIVPLGNETRKELKEIYKKLGFQVCGNQCQMTRIQILEKAEIQQR